MKKNYMITKSLDFYDAITERSQALNWVLAQIHVVSFLLHEFGQVVLPQAISIYC